MKRAGLIALIFCFCFPAMVWAGWVHTDKQDNTVVYIQDKKMKIQEAHSTMIFDTKDWVMTVLNPKNKTYWMGKPEEIRKEIAEFTKSQKDKILQQAPPEQRAALEKALNESIAAQSKETPPLDITVRPTGETSVIAGYDTKKYQLYLDGKMVQELWLAENVGLENEFDYAKLAEMMRALSPQAARQIETSPAVVDLLKKGWSLKTIDYNIEGQGVVSQDTKSLKQKDLDPGMFTIPDGYKKVHFTAVGN